MAVMVNGFLFFDIVEERILSCVHFRFRSLDLLLVARQFPPLLRPYCNWR